MSAQSAAESDGGPASRRRGLWAALIVSIALNVLFLGTVAGHVWAHHGWGHRHHHHSGFVGAVHELEKNATPERKKAFEASLERYRNVVGPRWDNVKKARKKVREALAADPFDPDAFQQRLNDMQKAWSDLRGAKYGVAYDLVTTLSEAERKRFLQGLKRGHHGRHHGHGKDDDDDDDKGGDEDDGGESN